MSRLIARDELTSFVEISLDSLIDDFHSILVTCSHVVEVVTTNGRHSFNHVVMWMCHLRVSPWVWISSIADKKKLKRPNRPTNDKKIDNNFETHTHIMFLLYLMEFYLGNSPERVSKIIEWLRGIHASNVVEKIIPRMFIFRNFISFFYNPWHFLLSCPHVKCNNIAMTERSFDIIIKNQQKT